MRINASSSAYREDPEARLEFSPTELRHLRTLLRRLQFLESKIRESGSRIDQPRSGGSAYAEWEAGAIEWALDELGFLETARGEQK